MQMNARGAGSKGLGAVVSALTAAILFLTSVETAEAAPPANFDARAKAVLQASGTPGMSVAIVEGGRTTLLHGYGRRRLDGAEMVGPDTIFPIASVSKAFTAAALAILVDQGRLSWDDKVTDRLPDFQLYDPLASREITVRDLLVHNSGLGLGAGDLLFWPRSTRSRSAIVRSLRHLKPAAGFRSGYAYDNVLYIAAGQLIEAVSGQTWEEFVSANILAPTGMTSAVTEPAKRFANVDRAQPHARLGANIRGSGEIQVLDERVGLSASAAPAGGVVASARDMSRWLAVQLARGKRPDASARVFSEKAAEEMWTPRTLMPRRPSSAPAGAVPLFATYALGWRVVDYKSHRIVWHTGGIAGYRSIAVLVPDLDLGFSVLTNAEDTALIMGLMYELLDHYIDPASNSDWPAQWAALNRAQASAAAKSVEHLKRDQSRPALPAHAYVGVYSDPWFGQISVTDHKGELMLDFPQNPGMSGRLTPWSRDTFRTVWDDHSFEPALVSFAFDPNGKVAHISMRAASPLADFSYDYQDLDFRPVDR
ncbi:MAG: serine hydrolase [Caulobacter sp.]